jgi:cytochrome d ubiquinol oxidase subunit II
MDLATLWFLLWGLLWAIYFITDGYDLGIGALLPVLGKSDKNRKAMLNVIGPVWDGNEVWLLTAGGVTFAAFPKTYAVMFSAFYSPLMLLLFALIFRGVAFEFRGKAHTIGWQRFWDTSIVVGSLLPAILLGVAFANLFRGIPLDSSGVFRGTILTFLNPYGLLGGVLFLLFFLVHGATWLAIKTAGDLHFQAVHVANRTWFFLLVTAVACLTSSAFATDLYDNYLAQPALSLIILIALIGLVGTKLFLLKQAYWTAWFFSAVTILGITFYGIVGLYPTMLLSTLNPAYSITVHDAASSNITLTIMLVVASLLLPVVIAYQVWAVRLFRRKLTDEELQSYGSHY